MIALVGSSWRTATTLQRARLAEAATDAISSLRESRYVTGAACIATCSRTEWILTADQPEWAGNLLRSALAARLPELDPRSIAVRAGGSAINHLLRVVVGLDSVAEGESAVGRQVLRAFEHSRTAGLSDRRLRHVWKHVERLIHLRRDAVPSSRACKCGRGLPLIERVEGRDADYVVTPAGHFISGISLTENFANLIPGTAQVQIVQESITQLRIRLVADDFGDMGRLKVAELVRDTFGDGVTHEVELVDAIPQEPSGKYRFCISKVARERMQEVGA